MVRDHGERIEETLVPRILTSFLMLPLLLSPGFPSDHPPADLLFVQIGAGLFGDNGFRTVFRLSNETGEAIEGTLILTATDGTALAAELAAAWTTPGDLQIEDNRTDFSIPPGSTLRLTVLPGEKAAIGWARLTRSGSLSVQTLFQYAEGLATPGPIFNFEDHIIRQIENHAVMPGKSFVFPVSLYYGFQTLNTAFAVVNLSDAPTEAELVLRPDNTEFVRLLPGEIYADYYDEFWTFAVPQIFPLRLEQLASVTSQAPIGLAVFNTIQGLPLSGVSVIEKKAEEGTRVEAILEVEFQLEIGQTAILQNEELEIQFWNLPEDSRCASDVTCIWEGQVRIILRVGKTGEEKQEVEVTSRAGQADLARSGFGDYTIDLIAVEPYPVSTQTIDLEDYVITLVVTRAEE